MTKTPFTNNVENLIPVNPKHKRSFWRGILAGVVAYVLGLVLVILGFHFIKPFIWFAFSSATYPSPKEVIEPDSIEWLVLQATNFLTWLAAGAAAMRWSASRSAPAVIGAIIFLLTFFGHAPATDSVVRLAIYYFGSPFGVAVGCFLFQRRNFLNKTSLISGSQQ